MQTATLKTVLSRLVAQAGADAMRDLSDAELLERFRGRREEAAFALLVQRHGPMVLGVCRRVLGDLHAAEDAFQATFLVLVRKADSIRKQHSLASWLFGIAQRTAVRARTQSAARRRCERESIVPLSSPDALEALTLAELYAVLEEEIGRLPDKYRSPLVLCCLEGKTHEQAAQEMVWPKSSVTARLKRARELLQQRLVRRGVALSGGGVAALLAEQTAAQAASAHLTLTTVRLAAEALADQTATATTAVALAGGLVKGLSTTKIAAALALLLTVGLAVAGVGVLASPKEEPKPETPLRQAPRTEPPKPEPVEVVRADQYGDPLPDGALARFGTTRLRHPSVQRLVFSAEGKTMLSFGRDLSLRQWDLSSGKLMTSRSITLSPDDPAPSYGHYPILSPDGKTLAFVTEKNLYFFDATDGKELHRIPNETGMEQKEFTPDSKQLAVTKFTPNKARELLLFDVATGTPVNTGVQWKNREDPFAFDPKGKQFALFNHSDDTVTLWALPKGERLHTIRSIRMDALAFAPDGKRLFAASAAKKKGFIWNTASFKEEATFPLTHDLRYGSVRTLAVSADGGLLAVAALDGIVLYDANTTKEIRQLTDRWCWRIWFSLDSKTLAASTGDGGSIRLWNVADGKPLHDVDSHDLVNAVAYSPDGKRLASGGDSMQNGRIYIWDVATTKCLTTIRRPWLLGPLRFSKDGQTLVGTAGFGTVKAWNVADGKEKAVFVTTDNETERGNQNITSLQLSRDGNRLSAISREGELFLVVVWDFATGKLLSRTKVSEDLIAEGLLAPDGRMLAYRDAAGDGLHIVLYDLATKQARATLPSSSPHFYSFSHDSTLLATHTANVSADSKPADPCVNLWETATGKLRIAFPTGQVIHKVFTPDKRFLLTTSETDLRLWEIATGKEVWHRDMVEMMRGKGGWWSDDVAVAPDGRSAAMGFPDANILVWDLLPSSRRKGDLTTKELEALWTNLGSDDAAKAYAAGGRFIGAPESSAAFLSKQLRPSADETKRIRSLIAALDDNEFTKREAAQKELEELGLAAEPELRRTLDGKPSAETRRVVETLLANVWTVQTAEERRQLRAVWVLEQIGSAEARQILKRLADGAAGARQTREARSALPRLDVAK